MIIGKKQFDLEKKAYIMGILNVTPDSFSDGGKYKTIDAALHHTEQMIADGMDIVDIGGESTRPGYQMITDEEEIERVAPVIEAIRQRFDVPISLDTYKSKVAEAGIIAGAHMINDIWGLKYDSNMAQVIGKHQATCCLMHNRTNMDYTDFLTDVKNDLKESLEMAYQAGIRQEQIVLDPGVGFAKTYEHNLWILSKLEELKELNCPILLGTSRKSVIGLTLDLPADKRVEGTIATTVLGRQKGASIFRVHDVKENKRALQMTEAILGF